MSFERINPIENEKSTESFERKKLRVANEIQVLIWNKICSPDENEEGECVQEWVDNYSDSFRTIFNEILHRDTRFLDKWDADIEERFNTRDYFIDKLKELDGPTERAA